MQEYAILACVLCKDTKWSMNEVAVSQVMLFHPLCTLCPPFVHPLWFVHKSTVMWSVNQQHNNAPGLGMEKKNIIFDLTHNKVCYSVQYKWKLHLIYDFGF